MIVPKGQGRSIMVSSFMCACHGTMRGKVNNVDLTSRVSFIPGQNGEGYWDNKDLANQLKEVIPLFEELHPNCVGIFAFDQSSNHRAMANDALVASRMNAGPTVYIKDKTVYKFRATNYKDADGVEHSQELYETETFDRAKVRAELQKNPNLRGEANRLYEKYKYPEVSSNKTYMLLLLLLKVFL